MTKTKQFLQAPWAAPANIHTLITTRQPEFNLALQVAADATQVLANRNLLQSLLPAAPLWLNQTHSKIVIDWDQQEDAAAITGDAGFSRQKDKVCLVMTADCLPILLTNQSGEFVAAIHAGWRGLNDGIIAQTITKLGAFAPQRMLAFIGPAICQSCFEVGSEVRASFMANDPSSSRYFSVGHSAGKFQANLRGIAAAQLVQLGLLKSNISNNNICSRCNQGWFYSYRGDPQCGRMACLIWRT